MSKRRSMDFPIEAEGENNPYTNQLGRTGPTFGSTVRRLHNALFKSPDSFGSPWSEIRTAPQNLVWGRRACQLPNMLYKIIPRVMQASQCAQSPDLLRLCLCAVPTGSACEAQQARQTASPPPAAVLEHNLVNVGTIHPPSSRKLRDAVQISRDRCSLSVPDRLRAPGCGQSPLQKVQEELQARGAVPEDLLTDTAQFHRRTKMWALVRDVRYVSDPKQEQGKAHPRGTAVDVTLVDRIGKRTDDAKHGYDDFSREGPSTLPVRGPTRNGGTACSSKLATGESSISLRFPFEWWHFDFDGLGELPAP